MIKRVVQVVLLLITFRWGVLAMVWGQVANSLLAFFINSYYTKRFIGYSIPVQLRDLFPYFAASSIMGLVVYFADLPLAPGNIVGIIFKVLLGVVVYLALSRSLKFSALNELTGFFRGRFALSA